MQTIMETVTTPFGRTALLAAALLSLAGSGVASAQDAAELRDSRWLPYLGCWVEVDSTDGPMTCVVPEGEGVAFLTVEGGAITDRYTAVAGGVEQPMAAAGCQGTAVFRFARESARVYTRDQLSCGDSPGHVTRGLMTFTDVDRWVRILALEGQGSSAAWTRSYRPASSERVDAAGLSDRVPSGRALQAAEGARLAAAGRVSVDEIIEAQARTGTEVVRAWIAEQGDPVRLDADRLVRLADAGVPESVIDVAVAVSFPDHFTVSAEADRDDGDGRGHRGYDRFGSCSAWSPFGYHDPYCFGYDRYRYGRYGYDYYGYDRYGYYGRDPVIIVVRPSDRSPTRGTMVRGRGYTSPGATDRPARPRSSVTRPSTNRGSAVRSGSKGKARPRGG